MDKKLSIIILAVVMIAVVAFVAFRQSTGSNSQTASGVPVNPPFPTGSGLPDQLTFVSGPNLSPYGNFNFSYPVGFLIKEDDIRKDATGKQYHVVVLAETVAASNTLEINWPDKTCQNYGKCQTVKGVVIGTNATDSEFLAAFNKVVAGF
ncbi:MAG: hypothetical protein KGJ89_04950 [Patescibacteria group bacterium]|nr:hypothetical protein [Patescibacteria group bacterium]MDE2015535.1 hypothetical protein [Patescibacteria group bacterium]MDE2227269.1 hypothetical protein [Patescibacteria group bacterium]